MGLMQKAVETYRCHEKYAGKYREGHTVLAPVSHIVVSAGIEIMLDKDGNLCSVSAVDKSEPKILIPATPDSAGRTSSKACAHPLSDQLCYLAPYNQKKYQNYIETLTKWYESEYSHPKLHSILIYVKRGTILEDLSRAGLIKLKDDGTPNNEKLIVRWRVLDCGDEDACWRDLTLMRSFTNYYREIGSDTDKNICMITGDNTFISKNNPKGIVPFHPNAKLISVNDYTNFTFRGRFSEDWQASTVGYEASQMAHNVLKWLATEQGSQTVFGGRTFLCWNPQGKKVQQVTGPFMLNTEPIVKPTDYRDKLKKTLSGCRSELPEKEGVVIAAFDAATSGRLSLTYYNELAGSDFLQRLYDWDLHCCWISYKYGIQSPFLKDIVNYAFGTQRTENKKARMVTDDKIMSQQMQRLVSCRIDRAKFPSDIVMALLHSASAPLSHEVNLRENILFTACAVIRKYRFDKFKEEWEMSLEPEKKDRSYQFGRLLAVMEKAERDTYDKETAREPNAIRQQSVFCQRPMYAAANIHKQLEQAYLPRLKPGVRVFYKNLMGQIMEQINSYPRNQWNAPLKETYLMGYYLQRNALYTKKNQNTEEN